jgi:hypothetical protein
VTDASTRQHNIGIPFIPAGEGYLELEISCLNLLPARYWLSLWIHGGGVVYDGLEHCTVLDIEGGNIYQSSRTIDNRHGIVYFPQRWNLAGVDQARRDARWQSWKLDTSPLTI